MELDNRTFTTGRERGLKSQGGRYVWVACSLCGTERWVSFDVKNNRPRSAHCTSCGNRARHLRAGTYFGSVSWTPGLLHEKVGYVRVKLREDDPFYSMANVSGYALQHRLVMAEHLGRCLEKTELVHHKNGIKDDNALSNLMVFSRESHLSRHSKESFEVVELRERVALLEAELVKLRSQVEVEKCWTSRV